MTVADRSSDPSATERAAPRCGVLIVDKPPGITSHDVVDIVRRRLGERSAGHLGTLDPAASGLLAVVLGAATRCATVWQGGYKTYEATLKLGVVTQSQDVTGQVIEERPVTIREGAVRDAALGFVGALMQVPPMVSAVRVGGERLHRLARRGITVERDPRPIHIAAWEWLAFDLPLATFRVRCSGGTYVRTLAHDLGGALGCGAALYALRRLASEPFDLAAAVTVPDLETLEPEESWRRAGIPLDRALDVLPALVLGEADVEALGFGRALALASDRDPSLPIAGGPRSIVFRDTTGVALALGGIHTDAQGVRLAQPHVVFPWAVREGRNP